MTTLPIAPGTRVIVQVWMAPGQHDDHPAWIRCRPAPDGREGWCQILRQETHADG
jgi:hypothetical protein